MPTPFVPRGRDAGRAFGARLYRRAADCSRADHQDAMAAGQGVTEFNATGAAAFEIRQLWNWIDHKLQPKVKRYVKAA